MATITVTLSDDRWVKLQETAAQLGVSAEELARASIEELSTFSEETFQQALKHVLDKNAELYRRLA